VVRQPREQWLRLRLGRRLVLGGGRLAVLLHDGRSRRDRAVALGIAAGRGGRLVVAGALGHRGCGHDGARRY
jgi:hypothetical protein